MQTQLLLFRQQQQEPDDDPDPWNRCYRVWRCTWILTDFDGTVGGNISGTSDLAPLDQQAAMLNELFPDAKNVGLLYCSAEANSQYQVDTVQGMLWKILDTPVNIMHSLIPTIFLPLQQQLPMQSDVIYVPTDNTVASNTEIINNICLPAKVPVIAGEEGICCRMWCCNSFHQLL